MDTPFTGRNVAKYVVQAAIAAKTAKLSKDAIAEHTQFEEDDMIVDISGTVIGWYVGAKLKPVTDKVVDKTADFIAKKRAERAAKKATSEEK